MGFTMKFAAHEPLGQISNGSNHSGHKVSKGKLCRLGGEFSVPNWVENQRPGVAVSGVLPTATLSEIKPQMLEKSPTFCM